MTNLEIVNYWIKSAEKDFQTMNILNDSAVYHWALFMGHLVIEKLLKAYYAKHVDVKVPFTHDLLRIANEAGIEISDDLADDLDLITTFNINARYPDYKQEFYKKCTKDYTGKNIKKIEDIQSWLKQLIRN